MEKPELRAFAVFLRESHGAAAFSAALARAKSLSQNGELHTAAVWEQIAVEVSEIETSDALQGLMEAPAGQA
jgi:hypothetical protein